MSLYTSNPHPCGYFSDPKHACRCSYQQIQRYRSRISGPLLEGVDIHVEVPTVPNKDLVRESNAESLKVKKGRLLQFPDSLQRESRPRGYVKVALRQLSLDDALPLYLPEMDVEIMRAPVRCSDKTVSFFPRARIPVSSIAIAPRSVFPLGYSKNTSLSNVFPIIYYPL